MTTKLASALPKSDELNGLNEITEQLCAHPDGLHVAVVVLDCSKITTDIDSDESTPTARVRRIEVITDNDDKAVLRRLATRALEKRTGKTVLPLDLEDELRAAFGDIADEPED